MGRIVIAAEDPGQLETLTRLLEDLGHEVARATDGEAAWALVSAGRPEVLLADVALPRRSGVELLVAVRDDPGLSAIPVILLAPAPLPRVPAPCRFVEKPIDAVHLRRAVHDALGAARAAAPAHPADAASARRRDLLLRWLVREIDERLTLARVSATRGHDHDGQHQLLAQLSRLNVLVDSLAAVVDYSRPDAEGVQRPGVAARPVPARALA